MSKCVKCWLIIAASLMVAGCIIFVGVMTVFKWDFTKLQTVKYETNDYEIDENYKNISIITNTADIAIVPCGNSKGSVVCYEQKNMSHSVAVKDGTLTIEVEDTRKWYEHIGLNFSTPKITVHIPQDEYGTLTIESSTGDIEIAKDFKFESIDISVSTGNVKNYASASKFIKATASTGDICVENAAVGALDLSASTGDVTAKSITCKGNIKIKVSTGDTKLTDITCENVSSTGSTGDGFLKNVIVTGKLFVERSTGDTNFDGCDAAEIFVKATTGDVKGRLLTDKVFIVQTDTGSIDVPKTTSGGKCEITTSTGDIKIDIQ